jgi:SAM-dependent methyltransferase
MFGNASSWIPALEGVEARLARGAKLADVGCGHGASTIVMARAYPASQFFGFDYHKPSIERARAVAADAGLGERVKFDVAGAKDFPWRWARRPARQGSGRCAREPTLIYVCSCRACAFSCLSSLHQLR